MIIETLMFCVIESGILGSRLIRYRFFGSSERMSSSRDTYLSMLNLLPMIVFYWLDVNIFSLSGNIDVLRDA
jgi:hypothetical protein